MVFLGFYGWRLSKEGRQMSAALAATELVLAREQKLHALDGLAAAAAHELGTPLGTIVLVAKELEPGLEQGSAMAEDLALLKSQAQRCREILQKLTRKPTESDPLCEPFRHATDREAVAPHRMYSVAIEIDQGLASAARPRMSATRRRRTGRGSRPGLI
jgi:two-component system sensor histidine kinase RegB